MNILSLVALFLAAVVFVAGLRLSTPDLKMFWDIPSLFIVVGGTLTELAKHPEFIPVPLLFTSTIPGGALTDQCYKTFHDEIIERLKDAGSVDGVLLLLHGAAVSVSVADIEGELL